MTFTFKSDGNNYVSPGWYTGFDDCLLSHKDSLIHKRRLEYSDIPGYTNGWAEANITAYWELHEKLKALINDRLN